MPSLITMLALQAVVLAVMYAVSPYPLPMVAAITVWGGLNFAIGAPIQTRILGWTADAPNLASSLIPSGFNIGIALAAFIGATMLNAGYGYRSLPLLGIAAMIVATAVALWSYIVGAAQRGDAAGAGCTGGVDAALKIRQRMNGLPRRQPGSDEFTGPARRRSSAGCSR